jgi:hypothetical protein
MPYVLGETASPKADYDLVKSLGSSSLTLPWNRVKGKFEKGTVQRS